MVTILLSPFFLLFSATSAATTYVGHRLFIEKAKPKFGDQCLTMIAAFQTLSLALATYQMFNGCYPSREIHPSAAWVITAFTGIAVAIVAVECFLASEESAP